MSEWRVGNHYQIHVYEGDRPVATFHNPEDAQRAVQAVNGNGWQPIETAPKELTSPSVLISDGEEVEEAYWSGEDWIAGDQPTFMEPTHWMHMPEPPKKD